MKAIRFLFLSGCDDAGWMRIVVGPRGVLARAGPLVKKVFRTKLFRDHDRRSVGHDLRSR
jgi:hypothetical protein